MSLLEIGLQHCNSKYKQRNNKTNYNRWGTLLESKIRATMRPREYENKGSLLTIFHITTQNYVHENSDCAILSVELKLCSFLHSYLGLLFLSAFTLTSWSSIVELSYQFQDLISFHWNIKLLVSFFPSAL